MKWGEWWLLDTNGGCLETLPNNCKGPEKNIYFITEWKLCRYRWKQWTRSVATLLLHCLWMDRVERVQAPPNALGNAVEQRASTDCRTTRKLGLPEKWEMVQGTNYAENCRRARTHMRSAPKDETARKMCKAELCTLWRRAVELYWWELVLLETSTCKVCLQKASGLFHRFNIIEV